MFSVVIPVFNKSQYIEKCLLSVACQTFQDFEVIIINDGSTDNSIEIIENIISLNYFKKVKLINKLNEGVSISRNYAVKHAINDFIAFIDADDWWEPSYLAEMKALIDDYPEAGIFGSNYYLIKNKKKRLAPVAIDPSFEKGIIDYFQVYAKTNCMPLWTSATIICKEIFYAEGGFKSHLQLGEDFDLWVRVALKHPVAFSNKHLSNYNLDVEIKNKAVGKMISPENHMLWNLTYLENEERLNPYLKQLLDNLRVYSLFPYFLRKKTREIAKKELNKVDWSKQSKKSILKYKIPIPLLMTYHFLRKIGSLMKKLLIHFPLFNDLFK